MVFSSVSFLFYFLPIFLLCYFLSPKRAKNYVLLIASLVFYYVGVQALVWVMLGCILLNYGAALLIDRLKERSAASKTILALTMIATFGVLFYYKYFDFVIVNINRAFGSSFDALGILLPVGISFYIFQTVSYTVDVYRREVEVQKNPFLLATYVTMFPQLVAGPIVRYKDVALQLKDRVISLEKTAYGIRRFVTGLAKKVILANTLALFCQNMLALEEKTVLGYWCVALAFAFQIYFDFSGYSDMAIGLGKILGFDFSENFSYPYLAKSVSEFFRRWHISLGTWFRDYVYIPLGGNRKGKWRLCLNLLIVWALTGLWHGAAWNFVLWGLFYALLLILEKLFLSKCLDFVPRGVGILYTFLAAIFGFVIFNAPNLSELSNRLGGMFGVGSIGMVSAESVYLFKSFAFLLLICAVAATPLAKRLYERLTASKKGSAFLLVAEPILLILLFLLSTAFLVDSTFNPFIYFRF